MAAGIVWLVSGSLILAFVIWDFLALNLTSTPVGGRQQQELLQMAFKGMGIFGVASISMGVKSIRGTARQPLSNGALSIVLSFAAFLGVAALIGFGDYLRGVFDVLAGCCLLAAGVLALVGLNDYKAWRRANRS
jgi:hypothetical protein